MKNQQLSDPPRNFCLTLETNCRAEKVLLEILAVGQPQVEQVGFVLVVVLAQLNWKQLAILALAGKRVPLLLVRRTLGSSQYIYIYMYLFISFFICLFI